jgi:hypothetical protein
LHVGVQEPPLFSEVGQFPRPPFGGEFIALHGLPAHVAKLSLPTLQVVTPVRVYPGLQSGVQLDPLASDEVQLPFLLLATNVVASQVRAVQDAEDSRPPTQYVFPEET